MSTAWEPPEDPAELAAWMNNFAETIPKYAEKLGFTPEEVRQIQRDRDEYCAAHEKTVSLRFDEVLRRLAQFRPREEWPAFFLDAADRWLLTPEPGRTRWLELLERWYEGVRRVQGKALRPELTGGFFREGICLHYTFPEGADWVSIYCREAGATGWEFLCGNSQPMYYLFTAPDPEGDDRPKPGQELEFVCIGCTAHENPLGFPSEIVRVRVPLEYPVPGAPV